MVAPVTPNGHVTFFFEDSKYGWSETLWDPTASATPEALQATALAYVNARLALLSPNCQLTYFRVSFAQRRGASYLVGVNRGGNISGGKTGPVNIFSDRPYSVVLLRLTTDTGYRKSIYMSGFPDDCIIDTPPYFDPGGAPGVGAALAKLTTILKASWGVKAKQNVTDQPAIVVPRITVTGPNSTLALAGALGAVTNYVHIYGPRNLDLPLGQHGVVLYDEGGLTVDVKNLGKLGNVYPAGTVTVQPVVPTIVPLAGGIPSFVKTTHRKRGRPFDSPRGRAHR